MKRKMLFIYNPYAGKGQINAKLGEIIDLFVKDGYQVEAYPTQGPKDAIAKARHCDEDIELIVCSGGDGTLDEVVTGLVQSGRNEQVRVGYIPLGTTNDYASSLGIPANVSVAAADIIAGEPKAYDVGRFNEDVFVYIAAFGIFTEVSYTTNQDLKKIFGHVAYVLEGMKQLAEIKSYWLEAEIDGEQYHGEFIYGMVSNSRSVGGFKNLTGDDVELDDGLFEVVLIRNPKNLMELQEIISALLIADDQTDLIISRKAKDVVITSQEQVPWTLDGEYGGSPDEVHIWNQSKAIEIISYQ